jgi:hypothetical protein
MKKILKIKKIKKIKYDEKCIIFYDNNIIDKYIIVKNINKYFANTNEL